MIPVVELLYDIDLRLNKVATSTHQSIPLEDKIIAINDAQIALVKRKSGGGAPSFMGLDGFKKQYEDLQVLIVPHQELTLKKDLTSSLHRHWTSITTAFANYLFYIDCYFKCSMGDCKDHRVSGRRIKHADLQMVLSNANTCPSFRYQEIPVTVTGNMLECYTDGTFELNSGWLSYLRYPRRVDMAGYIGFDGAPSITVDAELPYYLKDELVSLVVQQLGASTENQPATAFASAQVQQI